MNLTGLKRKRKGVSHLLALEEAKNDKQCKEKVERLEKCRSRISFQIKKRKSENLKREKKLRRRKK
jgi:hypothetical protein